MSSPRPFGSVGKRGTVQPVELASSRVALAPLLDSLDLAIKSLHAAHPERAAGLAAWADGMAAAGVLAPRLTLKENVRAVCEWFAAARDLDQAEREGFDSADAMDAAERLRLGQLKGRLVAGLRGVEHLPEVRAALDQAVSALTLPEREPKARPGVALTTHLGDTMMSMMLACGFGAGLGSKYTTRTAARHVVKIASCYGFDLNDGSLVTRASQQKKKG